MDDDDDDADNDKDIFTAMMLITDQRHANMPLVLIDTIRMLLCFRKTITGGPGMLLHSELTWVPPGIVVLMIISMVNRVL